MFLIYVVYFWPNWCNKCKQVVNLTEHRYYKYWNSYCCKKNGSKFKL